MEMECECNDLALAYHAHDNMRDHSSGCIFLKDNSRETNK